MPPKSHAILSASSSHRWLNCNPSARLEQEFEDQETEAASEGTAAHALCEHKLRKALKLRSKKPVSQYDCDEMDDYTDGYVQFVLEQLAQAKLTCPDPQVLIEQRLDFSCYPGSLAQRTLAPGDHGFAAPPPSRYSPSSYERNGTRPS